MRLFRRNPTGRGLAGAPPRLFWQSGLLIWNNQTALTQATPEQPAKTRRARSYSIRGSLNGRIARQHSGSGIVQIGFMTMVEKDGVHNAESFSGNDPDASQAFIFQNTADQPAFVHRAASGRLVRRPHVPGGQSDADG